MLGRVAPENALAGFDMPRSINFLADNGATSVFYDAVNARGAQKASTSSDASRSSATPCP